MNMTALLLGGPECLPRSMGILFSVALRLIADFQKTARNTAFSGSLRLLGQELSGGQLNGVKESQKTNSASEPGWPCHMVLAPVYSPHWCTVGNIITQPLPFMVPVTVQIPAAISS